MDEKPAIRRIAITVHGDSRIGYRPAIRYEGRLYVYRPYKARTKLKAYDKARKLAERLLTAAAPERHLANVAKWIEIEPFELPLP